MKTQGGYQQPAQPGPSLFETKASEEVDIPPSSRLPHNLDTAAAPAPTQELAEVVDGVKRSVSVELHSSSLPLMLP